jgi:hypothetical protein
MSIRVWLVLAAYFLARAFIKMGWRGAPFSSFAVSANTLWAGYALAA